MLRTDDGSGLPEAGVDEAGRGCLAGPVYAAAVILPKDYANPWLDDSKKLSPVQREKLRPVIERDAIAFGIGLALPEEIDRINILNASFLAMHRAIEKLSVSPGLLLIDGNRFLPYQSISHRCIVKGDSIYMSVAAASILAKTYRDDYMDQIHGQYPHYNWQKNKGYPTAEHRKAILSRGLTEYHRKTFRVQFNLFE